MDQQRWANDYLKCRQCKTTSNSHYARGLCHKCYQKAYRKNPAGQLKTQWYKARKLLHKSSEYGLVLQIKAQRRIRERRQKILQYLQEHPCIDCSESDPIVLQFDHVRGIKWFGVSEGLYSYNWDKINKEIKKCEIRCANCHIRKTAKQRGWWKTDVSLNSTNSIIKPA